MKTPDTFPHSVPELAAWGGTIYANAYTKNGQAYSSFRLVYKCPESSKRKTLGFKTIDAAIDGAKSLLRGLAAPMKDSLVLCGHEALRYRQALDSLAELPNAPALNIAVAEYVKQKRSAAILPPRTIQQVVDEMIKAKETEGLSARHIGDLKDRLARFARDFQTDIAHLSAPALSGWLRGLGLSPRSQNNFRGAIQTLASFARSCGYLPRDWNEIDAVPTLKTKNGKIAIFTPEEIKKLLKRANGKLTPFIAIGAFAGLRSAELERLTWDKVDLKRGYIHVDAEIAKTNSRRVVPIQPNLAKLLKPFVAAKGKVSPYAHVTPELMDLAKAAGVEWKQNALRHSYASYRLAVTQDAPRVALEMGNSPQMIQQHYRELVTPEQGKEWFTIRQ